jgi:hypothetical protein
MTIAQSAQISPMPRMIARVGRATHNLLVFPSCQGMRTFRSSKLTLWYGESTLTLAASSACAANCAWTCCCWWGWGAAVDWARGAETWRGQMQRGVRAAAAASGGQRRERSVSIAQEAAAGEGRGGRRGVDVCRLGDGVW